MTVPSDPKSEIRFRVHRTSVWSDETPPCEEATRTMCKRFDVRTCKSFEEFDERLGREQPWTSRGTEHKVLRGPRGGATGISRRLEDEPAWTVTLDLMGLLKFSQKYGDLVLSTSPAESDNPEDYMPSIEIYDDYRE